MKKPLFAAALLCLAIPAFAAPMTAANGMTVYTFDKDSGGVSACYEACAQTWPHVPADAVSGADFGSVERKDGAKQATYQGKPIYFFKGDAQPGDTKGDGIGGVWHVLGATAKPVAKPAAKESYGGSSYSY